MKIKIENYSFNHTSKTIVFLDYVTIRLDAVLIVVNTTSNIIIYNFADPLKGGSVSTNILLLDYDTTSMVNTDKLLIYYDDIGASQFVEVTNYPVDYPLPAAQVTTLTPKTAVKIIDTNNTEQGLLIEDGTGTLTSRDYFVAVAEGDVPNHKRWDLFGYNGDIDNTEEDLISQGGVYIFPALTGIQMDIVSTSANDDGSPVGTGVRTVRVYYLDNTGTEHTEDITMNGTAPVATVATNIARVNYIVARTVGSLGVAAGTITLSEHLGTTFNYGQITVGYTKARQCIFTVPLGKVLYINSLVVSGVNTSVGHWVRFTLRATYDEEELVLRNFFLPFAEVLLVDQSFHRNFITPLKVPAGADIKVSAISDAGAANELCACSLRGWIEIA